MPPWPRKHSWRVPMHAGLFSLCLGWNLSLLFNTGNSAARMPRHRSLEHLHNDVVESALSRALAKPRVLPQNVHALHRPLVGCVGAPASFHRYGMAGRLCESDRPSGGCAAATAGRINGQGLVHDRGFAASLGHRVGADPGWLPLDWHAGRFGALRWRAIQGVHAEELPGTAAQPDRAAL